MTARALWILFLGLCTGASALAQPERPTGAETVFGVPTAYAAFVKEAVVLAPVDHRMRVLGKAGDALSVQYERGEQRFRGCVPAAWLESGPDADGYGRIRGRRFVGLGSNELLLDDARKEALTRYRSLFPELAVEASGVRGAYDRRNTERLAEIGAIRVYPQGLRSDYSFLLEPELENQGALTQDAPLLPAYGVWSGQNEHYSGTLSSGSRPMLVLKKGTKVWIAQPDQLFGDHAAVLLAGPRGSLIGGFVHQAALERKDVGLGAFPETYEVPLAPPPADVPAPFGWDVETTRDTALRDERGREVALLPQGTPLTVVATGKRERGKQWLWVARKNVYGRSPKLNLQGYVLRDAISPGTPEFSALGLNRSKSLGERVEEAGQ
jgi:hypothetical protein